MCETGLDAWFEGVHSRLDVLERRIREIEVPDPPPINQEARELLEEMKPLLERMDSTVKAIDATMLHVTHCIKKMQEALTGA